MNELDFVLINHSTFRPTKVRSWKRNVLSTSHSKLNRATKIYSERRAAKGSKERRSNHQGMIVKGNDYAQMQAKVCLGIREEKEKCGRTASGGGDSDGSKPARWRDGYRVEKRRKKREKDEEETSSLGLLKANWKGQWTSNDWQLAVDKGNEGQQSAMNCGKLRIDKEKSRVFSFSHVLFPPSRERLVSFQK